jgi:putative MATE family efflux protein
MVERVFTAEGHAPRLVARPVGWTLWSLSWPTVIGLLTIVGANVLDTLYVGQLGAAELAAIGFCFPVIFTLSAVGFGFAAGATAVIAQAIGRGDGHLMRRTGTNTLILSTVVIIAMAVLGACTTDPIFAFLGARGEVLEHVRAYMSVYFWGLPVILLPVVLNGFIRATGEAALPAAVMVLGAVINALVSPMLIFGLWGSPALGIAGAAWGAVAARFAMTVLSLIIIQFRDNLLEFERTSFGEFWETVSGVVMVGIPAMLAQLITPISAVFLTRILAGYGEDVIAAFAVGSRIEAFFLIAFWALQSAVAPFVGQNFGAQRVDRLIEAELWIRRFSVFWGLFALAVAVIWGRQIASLFTDSIPIADASARYFAIVAAGFIGAGLMLGATAVFYSLGRPLLATVIIALRFFALYVPLGIYLSLTNGPNGVFAAAMISYLGAGVVGMMLVERTLKGLHRHF